MVCKAEIPFTPTRDFVLLEILPQDVTPGGIAMPEGVSTEPPRGLVLAAGPGDYSVYDAKIIPHDIKVGQIVWLLMQQAMPPMQVEFGGRKCLVVRASAIMGICKDV